MTLYFINRFILKSVAFMVIFSSLGVYAQEDFRIIDKFTGFGSQQIQKAYAYEDNIYFVAQYRNTLLSENNLFPSLSGAGTFFGKFNSSEQFDFGIKFEVGGLDVKVHSFLAIPDDKYILSVSGGRHLTVNDTLELSTTHLRQDYLFLLNEGGGILDYIAIEADTTVQFAEKLIYKENEMILALSSSGILKFDNREIQLNPTRENIAVVHVPVRANQFDTELMEYDTIGGGGDYTISDQCMYRDKHFITGTFTQDFDFGDSTYFNNSFRSDVFIAEVRDSEVVNGFGLSSSSPDEAGTLNVIGDQLLLTAYCYRSIKPHPLETPTTLPGFGVLLATYDHELGLKWNNVAQGQELRVGNPTSLNSSEFIIPITITDEIKYDELEYSLLPTGLYESVLLRIANDGNFIGGKFPAIGDYEISSVVMMQENEFIMSLNSSQMTFQDMMSSNEGFLTYATYGPLQNKEVSHSLITIFPNPTINYIMIRDNGNAWTQYRIYDITGQLMTVCEKGLKCDVSELVPGLYLVNAQDVDGNFYSGKFIKKGN